MAETFKKGKGSVTKFEGGAKYDEIEMTGGAVDPRDRKDRDHFDAPFRGQFGLRVSLHPIRHVTAKNALRQTFRFQVPPLDEFGWEQAFTWTDYETAADGTFSRPGGRGLRVVSFDTMFLDYDASWTVVHTPNRPNPVKAGEMLRQLMNAGTPFRLVVRQKDLWGEREDIAMAATLRNVRVIQRAGEVDARYVAVEFVEHRSIELRTKRRGRKGKHLPTRHKITPSTEATLRDLARRYYGSPKEWRLISRANKALWWVTPNQPLKAAAYSVKSIRIPKRDDDRIYK